MQAMAAECGAYRIRGVSRAQIRRYRYLLRTLAVLLCLAQVMHVAHAMPRKPAIDVCGHFASLASIAPLAEIDGLLYAKALRSMLGGDLDCQQKCSAQPPLPRAIPFVPPAPDSTGATWSDSPVSFGASRFGRLRPPATGPPNLA